MTTVLPSGPSRSDGAAAPFEPVVGLGRLEPRLRGVDDGVVVALAAHDAGRLGGVPPVDVGPDRRQLVGIALDVLEDGVAAAPTAVALLRRRVADREVLALQQGHGRRPHGLGDDLTGLHEVDRVLEHAPEGAEVPALLLLDEVLEDLVDLGLRHVALVGEGHDAGGLDCHGGVHEADLGIVDQRDAALELVVDQDGPRVLLADLLLVVAERVGVVVGRRHRQLARLARRERDAVVLEEDLAEGRVAVALLATLLQRTELVQPADLAPPCDVRRVEHDELVRTATADPSGGSSRT